MFPLMTLSKFNKLSKRDLENGAILDEIRNSISQLDDILDIFKVYCLPHYAKNNWNNLTAAGKLAKFVETMFNYEIARNRFCKGFYVEFKRKGFLKNDKN